MGKQNKRSRRGGNPVKEAADKIIALLKEQGFHILRYDSYTTRSIYLKMDCGVAGSIRISDHTGKPSLNYRFNVHTNIDKSYADLMGVYDRYYYCVADIHAMVDDAVSHRENRMIVYGAEKYNALMKKNIEINKNAKGFWGQARRV